MTTTIDEEHVEAWGDVDRALSRYYETQVRRVVRATGMDELVLRDWFDKELITERGFRDQTSRGPGDGGKRADRALQLLTDAHVIRAERRRDVTWYELAHDRLLEPLQTSNRTWRQENPDFQKREAEEGDYHGPLPNAGPRIQVPQRAARRARWITFLTRVWLRRNYAWLLMNLLVAAVVFLAWWFAGPPPVGSSGAGLVVAFVAGWFLSVLPGWLYLSFLRDRMSALWNEYVLNLHRLAWDRPRHLPKPPVNSVFFVEWSNDGGDILADQVNIYRQKFDAYYGRSTSQRSLGDPIKIQTLFPVFLVTGTFAICWTAVLWNPSFVWAPMSVWDVLKFAFLGAYSFGVLMLIRRYFQSDLRPSAYAGLMFRIILVLIVVAVISSFLPTDSLRIMAAVAFVIGFFPMTAFQALQRAAAAVLRVAVPSLTPRYPLNELDGLNLWYEARLTEEGIEDMQNLTTANLVDVILHTRVPVGRLVDWIDQALLYLHVDRIDHGLLEHRKNAEGAKNDPLTISRGSVTPGSKAITRTRTALRQLGIRTATDLLTVFPPNQVDWDSGPRPDTSTEARWAALRAAGLNPSQILTVVRLLNDDQVVTLVWKWRNRSRFLGGVGAERTELELITSPDIRSV